MKVKNIYDLNTLPIKPLRYLKDIKAMALRQDEWTSGTVVIIAFNFNPLVL